MPFRSPIFKDLLIFPECVARVPVSLWGSGGWGCVRSSLPSRPQPFATVGNRPQPFVRSPYGRAYSKFCRRGHFWRFQTSGCFVSRGRCGTSWHSDVFCNVSNVVLCGGRNTFATFSQDELHFSWQAQHFGRVHRHFAWQAQHFFEVANFQVLRKTRRKTSILKLQSVKVGGSLARNARFDAPTRLVSSLWFFCGLAVSMWEAA